MWPECGLNVDEDSLFIYLFSWLAVWEFSKYEVTKSCLNMVERRMKEPEDTLTEHGIKRMFLVLLTLRILLAVGTQLVRNNLRVGLSR